MKSRAAAGAGDELLHRIADQVEATEEVLRDLFFRRDNPRLDHVLQRSRLTTILRFYLDRAVRHGLISSDESRAAMEDSIGRLESAMPDLKAEKLGFVVNLQGAPQRPVKVGETKI